MRYKGTWWQRPRHDPVYVRMALHSALRLGNVDMGELVINHPASRVDPTLRLELVDALVAIELSLFTGEFDACEVKMVLGEAGEVWPASVC
jgi:hypothetical protein